MGLYLVAVATYLAKCVVDLMGSSMVQILSLQPDVGTASVLSQSLGEMEVARSTHVWVVGPEFFPELGVVVGLIESMLEFPQAVHQDFWDVLSTEFSETSWDNLTDIR